MCVVCDGPHGPHGPADSSESGEVSSSSGEEEEEEAEEASTTLVEEGAGPGEDDILTGPLFVRVPRDKVHVPGLTASTLTAIVHPKPQAEKQKVSLRPWMHPPTDGAAEGKLADCSLSNPPPQAIVEPIVVTPVERARRHSRGTSRDADDGGHLRYSHRAGYR